jgi:hypothetical protein
MSSQAYAIIATEAGTFYGVDAVVGTVVNRVMWNGDTTIWSPDAGTEARADPTGALDIGIVVTP